MIGMGAVGYQKGEKEKGTIRQGGGEGGGHVEGHKEGQCGGGGGG